MLDPDVLVRTATTRDHLVPAGRAILEPEDRDVHRAW